MVTPTGAGGAAGKGIIIVTSNHLDNNVSSSYLVHFVLTIHKCGLPSCLFLEVDFPPLYFHDSRGCGNLVDGLEISNFSSEFSPFTKVGNPYECFGIINFYLPRESLKKILFLTNSTIHEGGGPS